MPQPDWSGPLAIEIEYLDGESDYHQDVAGWGINRELNTLVVNLGGDARRFYPLEKIRGFTVEPMAGVVAEAN